MAFLVEAIVEVCGEDRGRQVAPLAQGADRHVGLTELTAWR